MRIFLELVTDAHTPNNPFAAVAMVMPTGADVAIAAVCRPVAVIIVMAKFAATSIVSLVPVTIPVMFVSAAAKTEIDALRRRRSRRTSDCTGSNNKG